MYDYATLCMTLYERERERERAILKLFHSFKLLKVFKQFKLFHMIQMFLNSWFFSSNLDFAYICLPFHTFVYLCLPLFNWRIYAQILCLFFWYFDIWYFYNSFDIENKTEWSIDQALKWGSKMVNFLHTEAGLAWKWRRILPAVQWCYLNQSNCIVRRFCDTL